MHSSPRLDLTLSFSSSCSTYYNNNRDIPNVSKSLRVEFARGDGRVKRKEDERRKNIEPSDTLFVVNFHEETTRQEDLEFLFQPFGELLRIDMKRNYAFVQFKTIEQATKAKETTNGGKLDQAVLTVEYVARQRDNNGNNDRRRRDRGDDRRHGRGGGDRFDHRRRLDNGPPRHHRRESPPPYRGGRRSRSRSRSPPYRHGYRSRYVFVRVCFASLITTLFSSFLDMAGALHVAATKIDMMTLETVVRPALRLIGDVVRIVAAIPFGMIAIGTVVTVDDKVVVCEWGFVGMGNVMVAATLIRCV